MEVAEIKINQIDVTKLEIKPGQILIVNIQIPAEHDFPPMQLKKVQTAYAEAFRSSLDQLGLTKEQVPILVSTFPLTVAVIDTPAPVLLPGVVTVAELDELEKKELANLAEFEKGVNAMAAARDDAVRHLPKDEVNCHPESDGSCYMDHPDEYPRGRPFEFTPELLEKMASMPQAPDDEEETTSE